MRRAAEAAVGHERDRVTEALAHERRGDAEHLAHARAAATSRNVLGRVGARTIGLRAGRKRAKESTMGPSKPLRVTFALASLTVAACGGSPPSPVEAPKVEPTKGDASTETNAAQDDKAAKARALDALVAGEAKSGTCDEGHKAALEKLLADVELGMRAKSGEDGKPLGLQLVAKRVLPLGTATKQIEMAVTGKGTEVHVLAFGVREVGLDVLVGSTAATTMRSPFQRSATTGPLKLELPILGAVDDLQSDSRQFALKPGQPIVVKLSGQGCVALASFVKP